MNKLIIPAILAATVMVAGIFAFMPVERASTVHTTIIAEVQSSTVLSDNSITAAKLAADAITEINDGSLGSDVLTAFTTDLGAADVTVTSTTDFVTCITADNPTGTDGDITVNNNGNTVSVAVFAFHSVNAGCFGGVAGTNVVFGSAIALDAHIILIAEGDATATIT